MIAHPVFQLEFLGRSQTQASKVIYNSFSLLFSLTVSNLSFSPNTKMCASVVRVCVGVCVGWCGGGGGIHAPSISTNSIFLYLMPSREIGKSTYLFVFPFFYSIHSQAIISGSLA